MGGHRKKTTVAESYFSTVKDFWTGEPVLPIEEDKLKITYDSKKKKKGLKKKERIKQELLFEKDDGDIYSHDYGASDEDPYLRKGPKRKIK